MVFRLAVIPAGSVESAQGAKRLVAAMCAAPLGHTPAAVVEVLGALDSSGVSVCEAGRRADSRGALLSVPHPEAGVLEALLILARDHDLAVYDIGLDRLYDPTGGVDVDALVPGVRIPFVTRELLEDLVLRPGWPEPEAPYVILDRADQDFIQVWCETASYRLEYREGSAEFHYMCASETPAVVVDVMWDWTIGGTAWRGALPWEFLDLDKTRSVSVQDLDATVDADGTLRIHRQDLVSAAEQFGGEHESWYTVLADDVPKLVAALGGAPGGDILDVLVERYAVGGDAFGSDLDRAGVSYTFACWP